MNALDMKTVQQRFNSLNQEFQKWEPSLKILQQYVKPTRGFFSGQLPNDGKLPDHKTILDGHAARAIRILAAGMTSGLTSPSRPWFKVGLQDKDLEQFQPVKVWLEILRDTILMVYSRSNIYGIFNSIYEEIGTFGTGASALLSDFLNGIRGRSFTAGEYRLGVDNTGRVDTFARCYNMTVGQLVQEYGIDFVSDSTRRMFGNNQVDQWVKVNHLIEPNDTRIIGLLDNRNMPYRAIYWEEGNIENGSQPLRVTGFDLFPIICPRWDCTTTADIYGKGPSWEAIGDIKMLQQMQKEKLTAIAKMINPPVQVDSNVMNEANMLPGGVTHFSGTLPNAGVRPAYQISPEIQQFEIAVQNVKSDISKAFYSDLFLAITGLEGTGRSATEIIQRHEEKLIMLGSVLDRLENELLDPTITRTINILLRSNVLPPPPQEIQGQEMNFEYISMLAQAQKMIGTTALEQGSRFIGSQAAVNPEVLDVIDQDQMTLEYCRMIGIPANVIRSKEKIYQIRQQRAQAAQQAQAMQQAGQYVQGAKVLSETKVGQNSALELLTGGAR